MIELRAGNPVVIRERTIIPIERVTVSSDKIHQSYCFFGLKEPVSLIVIESGHPRAVDMKACEISLGELKNYVTGLDEILENLLIQNTP